VQRADVQLRIGKPVQFYYYYFSFSAVFNLKDKFRP